MSLDVNVSDLWTQDLGYRVRISGRGQRALLTGVDIAVGPGQVTGVLGPNGSGKSTLLRLIIGALGPSDGQIWMGEADLAERPQRERARQVALVEQDAQASGDLSVTDVVLLGRIPYRPAFGGESAQDRGIAADALRRVGAQGLAHRSFATLSGGERQRVHLARALAQTPRVLLLDEPTNHLDVAAQLDLLAVVSAVAGDGAGVLMAIHDLALAARICDQVVVLDGGQVVAAGPARAVLTPELIAQVWGVAAEWVRGTTGTGLILS